MKFILLTATQAATVRGETENLAALAPRKIVGGSSKGKFALPVAVLDDPDHEMWRDFLKPLPQVDLVVGTAWPPED